MELGAGRTESSSLGSNNQAIINLLGEIWGERRVLNWKDVACLIGWENKSRHSSETVDRFMSWLARWIQAHGNPDRARKLLIAMSGSRYLPLDPLARLQVLALWTF